MPEGALILLYLTHIATFWVRHG